MKKVMERTKKNIIYRLPALLLCALLLSACGPADNGETASVPNPGESAASVENTGETISAPAASVENTDETISAPAASASEGAPSSEVQETTPDQSAASKDKFDGTIEEIGPSSFRIIKTFFSADLDDGRMVAVDPVTPDPADSIEVTYTEDTVFTICSSSDMGITSTNSEATAADLEKGRSVYVTGTRNESVFHAEEVTIYHFD